MWFTYYFMCLYHYFVTGSMRHLEWMKHNQVLIIKTLNRQIAYHPNITINQTELSFRTLRYTSL